MKISFEEILFLYSLSRFRSVFTLRDVMVLWNIQRVQLLDFVENNKNFEKQENELCHSIRSFTKILLKFSCQGKALRGHIGMSKNRLRRWFYK